MCGIFGYVGGPLPPTDMLRRALDTLSHRGPDSDGCWSDGPVFLGHRRLAIIDLDPRSNQPMFSGDGSVVLVFNGEIYNYQDLRKGLSEYEFRTDSDTEVIIAAYLRWGVDFAKHLNGMFALGLYDARTKQLHLVRDRVGKKPLYYYHAGSTFAFASESRALSALVGDKLTLDPVAVNSYFATGTVGGGRAIYREMRQVLPAQIVTISIDPALGELRRKHYWQLEPEHGAGTSEADLLDELESLLSDAIRIRLRSDVPLGLLLSGGIDSSLIAALATKLRTEPLQTFSIGFRGTPADEAEHARKIAITYGTTHVELESASEDQRALQDVLASLDEPFADSSAVPMYMVSRLARQRVTVALSGDGGDELFAGYGHYDYFAWEHSVRERWPDWSRRLLGRIAMALPERQKVRSLRRLVHDEQVAGMAAYYSNFFTYAERAALLRGGPIQPDPQPEAEILGRFIPGLDWIQNVCQADFQGYMVDDILVKVDRMSMLSSLEIRSPLLDYRIAEFAFRRVPSTLKRRQADKKYLLKQLARRHLPVDFDFKRKHGFGVPLSQWFRGWAGELLEQRLCESPSGVVDSRFALKILHRHRSGFSNHGKQLYALLAWEEWYARSRREFCACV